MDFIKNIEENVYKVWDALNSKGSLPENKLISKTNLEINRLYSAIGWLARENKICVTNGYYELGETNLTTKIGKNAGKVWLVLDTWGEIDIVSITRLARIDENDVFSALGWLAREGKIEGIAEDNNKNKLKIWLR